MKYLEIRFPSRLTNRRWKFFYLESGLFIAFLIVSSLINMIFGLEDTSNANLFAGNEYYFYLLAMFFLISILGSMFFLAGMYFQLWLSEKAGKRILSNLEEGRINPDLLKEAEEVSKKLMKSLKLSSEKIIKEE